MDREEYFVINRARQYGKTTTLSQLRKLLSEYYTVISISFQNFDSIDFESSSVFCQEFLKNASDSLKNSNFSSEWMDETIASFSELSRHITKICKEKKVVLMIDEVDRASNYHVFLNFLAILRAKFNARADGYDFTFHSVILAGVYESKT